MSVDAIRVGIRARPFGKQQGQARVWNTNDKSLVLNVTEGQGRSAGKQFNFDHVWDEHVPQGTETIHAEFTTPVVDAVLQGFHGTVAMYGQTGSAPPSLAPPQLPSSPPASALSAARRCTQAGRRTR